MYQKAIRIHQFWRIAAGNPPPKVATTAVRKSKKSGAAAVGAPPRQPARSQPVPVMAGRHLFVGAERCRREPAVGRARFRALCSLLQEPAKLVKPSRAPIGPRSVKSQCPSLLASASWFGWTARLVHHLSVCTLSHRPIAVNTSCVRGAATLTQNQVNGSCGSRLTPSFRAACCQGLRFGGCAAGAGAVSRMNCSSAATTAAASSGEASGATIVSFGRRLTMPRAYRARASSRGRRLPVGIAVRPDRRTAIIPGRQVLIVMTALELPLLPTFVVLIVPVAFRYLPVPAAIG
jgi:hypothetical protein